MKIKELVEVRPSRRQFSWQQIEFYGFIHFGMNTMTDREWGLGHEDPHLFDPKDLDCDQWINELQQAGMRGAILTCKHHDGFCLWPSQYTEHTVANSPWKNGHGDLVAEFSAACQKYGMKFGIYLSPWDRTETSYGQGVAYDDFYVHQLEELLSNYGDIFEIWFDGANGEGASGNKQVYDWDRYYKTIRRLQPEAVIAVCGPDVRWVGNEVGDTRANEWSVVPKLLQDIEKIAERSQQVDDHEFSRKVNSGDNDLGSQKVLAEYTGELIWYPAEVNTSIRPGWFYHKNEDQLVRDSDELFDLYCKAVGGNATFLLNIPPTPQGILAEPDLKELHELGVKIQSLYQDNLVESAKVTCSSALSEELSFEEKSNISWQPAEEDQHPWINLTWEGPVSFNAIILQEDIHQSQRIEKCVISSIDNGMTYEIVTVESIGYKRILRFPEIHTTELEIKFEIFREYPTIANVIVTKL